MPAGKTAARRATATGLGKGSKKAARPAKAAKVARAAPKRSPKVAAKAPARGAAKRPAKGTASKKAGKAAGKPVLLSGGNPQIPMGEGEAPVQAYIAAVPDWRRDVVRRIDELITGAVPGVKKAVKWNSPFYGIPGQGWFASTHVFTNYVKLTFFRGSSLKPVPAGGKHPEGRWIDVGKDGTDEAQLVAWVKQAAALPGWGTS